MTTKTKKFLSTIIALTALLSIIACTTPEPPPAIVVAPTPIAPTVAPPETQEQIAAREMNTAARVTLTEGIELYTKGDYRGALQHLSGITENPAIDKSTQLDALKYMAFSYCLTNKKPLCKQQFEKALKLDSSFDLLPGEKGHPLWQDAFDKAKKGS